MRVDRIDELSNHKIFRSFQWPAGLPNFSRFNLIYGWNGSGKTTLSNVFRSLQRGSAPEGTAILTVEGARLRDSDFPVQGEVPIRVFNRDFVNQSVRVDESEFTPIYYIGEVSVELRSEIEELRKREKKLEHDLSVVGPEREQAQRAHSKFATDQARKIKNLLRASSPTGYESYDRRGFIKRIDEARRTSADAWTLTEEELGDLVSRKSSDRRDELTPPAPLAPAWKTLIADVGDLIARDIRADRLSEFDEQPSVQAWVQEGLRLHTVPPDGGSTTCRFCSGDLTTERREALEGHFNDAVTKLQDDLTASQRKIEKQIDTIGRLRDGFPDPKLLYPDLQNRYRQHRHEITEAAAELSDLADAMADEISRRKDHPLSPSALEADLKERSVEAETTLLLAMNKAFKSLEEHNEISARHEGQIREACAKIERASVAECLADYWELERRLNSLSARQEELDRELSQVRVQRRDKESSLLEHRGPAEQLNSELHSYLGRSDLAFRVEDDGYALTRGGSEAQGLSEGERTAVAFLYFLKTLEDRDFRLSDGVIVVDDPVSSLDAGALFSAFAHLRDRTQDAGQLFVLTHNFTFFRQVRTWFKRLPGQREREPSRRPAQFYFLEVTGSDVQRSAIIKGLDHFLLRYNSEYQYLFKLVWAKANSDDPGDAASYYPFPNLCRRLLEGFLAFKFPAHEGDLTRQLQMVDFDGHRRERILRFLHAHSHAARIAGPDEDPTPLVEAPAIIDDVLSLMATCDPQHYAEMKSLVSSHA